MPPAFVLSQDQTLRKTNYFIRKSDSKHLKLCCFDYIGKPMSQIEFSRLHRTIQFSISYHFLWRLIIYHSLFRLSSELLKIFEFFYQLLFRSDQSRLKQHVIYIYHKNWFCQTQFLIFFDFFYQPVLLSPELRRRKTRHNISPKIDLSNDFQQKNAKICDFFAIFAPNARARVRRVCMRVQAGVFVFGCLLWHAGHGG